MKRLVLLAAVAAATRRRVAVCFWGINRSLDLTLPSIQKHLLAPLADHDVELFFHTYTQKRASESAPTRRACATRTRGYLLAGSRTSCA